MIGTKRRFCTLRHCLFCFLFPLLSPDFVCHFYNHPQFRPLLVFSQDITLFCGGETALRLQAKLIECNVSAGFVDAALDRVFRLKPP